jgi:hypothetical protein
MNLERILQDGGEVSLRGFEVDACDGPGGKVEQVLYWSDATNPDYIVVSQRRWIFGRKSVLPVGSIENIDVRARRLKVGMSRQQVLRAPRYLPLG